MLTIKQILKEVAALSEFPFEEKPETEYDQVTKLIPLSVIKAAHSHLEYMRIHSAHIEVRSEN